MSMSGVTNFPIKRPPPAPDFEPFSPADTWLHQAPSYDWMVDGCFLKGTVALLSGDGGLGKSLLLQQLCTCAAIGERWLDFETTRCPSLVLFCEDSRDELHRRQERINAHYRCTMRELADVTIVSRQGMESVLMRFPQWGDAGCSTTELYERVAQTAIGHGARIVALDTLADVYSGNEVDRNQPRTFVRAMNKLALRIQGTVILTQHPSVDGLASGSGRSGSTGWRNSVRSMLYLTTPKRKLTEEHKPTNERWLRTMKNNAGPYGHKIRLEYRHGVFVRMEEQADASQWWVSEED